MHRPECPGGEEGFAATGRLHAMADIGTAFPGRERSQMVTRRDALGDLAQFRALEQLVQFRLADEDNLQQLFLGRLQIRQESNLFQDVGGQVLRFINDEHRPSALLMRCQQMLIQRIDQHLETGRAGWIGQAQFVTHGGQQLDAGQARIPEQRHIDFRRQLFQQGAAQRGLAGTDFAGQLHKATVSLDTVEEMGHRLAVAAAHKEVPGIRRDHEWDLGEAKVRRIHRSPCMLGAQCGEEL